MPHFFHCSNFLFSVPDRWPFSFWMQNYFRDRIDFPFACLAAPMLNPGSSGISDLLSPRREGQ